MPEYPRIPFDIGDYTRRVRADARDASCFICDIVSGSRDDHLVVFRDHTCIAFLAKWPTLLGLTLVAPLEHRTDVVGAFTAEEYLELQRRVHRIGRAVSEAVPTERLYLLSLGSRQGNSHVHWHVAPLPPGVPYAEQQYAALMHENGYLDVPDADLAEVAQRIRAHDRERLKNPSTARRRRSGGRRRRPRPTRRPTSRVLGVRALRIRVPPVG